MLDNLGKFSIHLEREIAVQHQLNLHKGKCRNTHGHNLFITCDVETNQLLSGSSDGMVIDFGDIKQIIEKFDHSSLNDHIEYGEAFTIQPTAERLSKIIAMEIAKKLAESLDKNELVSIEVSVQEARGQSSKFSIKRKSIKEIEEFI